MVRKFDFLVIGSGIAGMSFALKVAHKGKVALICKSGLEEANTYFAQGGVASVTNLLVDNFDKHIEDTMNAGDWISDRAAVEKVVREAPAQIEELIKWGVDFDKNEKGEFDLHREGGHSEFRILHHKDNTGAEIQDSLIKAVQRHPNITVIENQFAIEILTQHHLGVTVTRQTPDIKCYGAYILDPKTGKVDTYLAKVTLMATGGVGAVYKTTTNPLVATGDGIAMVYRAKGTVKDMEFVQFHPTGLAHTGILLSEAARAEGGILRNADGEPFMERYAPEHKDLAARDVVSRSIMAEIDAGRGVADPKDPDGPKDCVWLDMTGIDPERMKEVLPQVVETIEQYANLDPAKDLVPIKPTAHYTMGGIPITTDGEVYRWADGAVQVVDGLFAAGECSCVSVHGANRLGGNSLLDACLFGTRAGQTMAARIAENPVDSPMADDSADDMLTDAADQAADSRKAELDELLAGPIDDSDDGVPTANPYQLMAQLGSVMEQALAVRCTAQTIDTALTQINGDITPVADTLRAHDKTAAFNQEVTAIWEVRHLIELAEVMLHASESRQESRGSMQRLDFPERDDEHFLAHSMVADDGSVSFKPVHITDYPPKKREY